MKRFVFLWLAFVSLLFTGCYDYQSTREVMLLADCDEVAPGVYDNHQNMVYIKINKTIHHTDSAIIDIIMKKKGWEAQFPGKKVAAMSIVNGYGDVPVAGMLIYYETR